MVGDNAGRREGCEGVAGGWDWDVELMASGGKQNIRGTVGWVRKDRRMDSVYKAISNANDNSP